MCDIKCAQGWRHTFDHVMFCVVSKFPKSSRTCISISDANRSFHIESWKGQDVLILLYQHNQPNHKWCKVIILSASIPPHSAVTGERFCILNTNESTPIFLYERTKCWLLYLPTSDDLRRVRQVTPRQRVAPQQPVVKNNDTTPAREQMKQAWGRRRVDSVGVRGARQWKVRDRRRKHCGSQPPGRMQD